MNGLTLCRESKSVFISRHQLSFYLILDCGLYKDEAIQSALLIRLVAASVNYRFSADNKHLKSGRKASVRNLHTVSLANIHKGFLDFVTSKQILFNSYYFIIRKLFRLSTQVLIELYFGWTFFISIKQFPTARRNYLISQTVIFVYFSGLPA